MKNFFLSYLKLFLVLIALWLVFFALSHSFPFFLRSIVVTSYGWPDQFQHVYGTFDVLNCLIVGAFFSYPFLHSQFHFEFRSAFSFPFLLICFSAPFLIDFFISVFGIP